MVLLVAAGNPLVVDVNLLDDNPIEVDVDPPLVAVDENMPKEVDTPPVPLDTSGAAITVEFALLVDKLANPTETLFPVE